MQVGVIGPTDINVTSAAAGLDPAACEIAARAAGEELACSLLRLFTESDTRVLSRPLHCKCRGTAAGPFAERTPSVSSAGPAQPYRDARSTAQTLNRMWIMSPS